MSPWLVLVPVGVLASTTVVTSRATIWGPAIRVPTPPEVPVIGLRRS